MSGSTAGVERKMSVLEKNLLGTMIDQTPQLLPGLLVAALLAWLSTWLGKYIGVTLMGFEKSPISAVMIAILLGLIVGNTIPLPKSLKPGLTFAVKKLLRLGIIMLGIRLSIFDVFKAGALGVPIVVLCILSALLFTTRLNKRLKLPERLGILIAVGTSICGVSAIIATGPAIGAKDEEVAYAVAVITIFGIIATLAYPYAAYVIFAGDAVKAGLFLGTAIHDTSQVTGAALVFSEVFSLPQALDVACVTKLVRNVFMAAVIPFMALSYTRSTAGQNELVGTKTSFSKLLPLFVVGFLVFATLRSIGDAGIRAGGNALGVWPSTAWNSICGSIKYWAVNLLVASLAAVGLGTRFNMLKDLGIKPFIMGLGAALTVGIVSFVIISLLGMFVTV